MANNSLISHNTRRNGFLTLITQTRKNRSKTAFHALYTLDKHSHNHYPGCIDLHRWPDIFKKQGLKDFQLTKN